jgi:hypothetical protein
MSLDVYLGEGETTEVESSGIFVRKDGQTREVTADEFYDMVPRAEPISVKTTQNYLYHDNITHNLAEMAAAADLYMCLWRPEGVGAVMGSLLAPQLRRGLKTLKKDPDFFRAMNPVSGWGTYEGLVAFVERYLAACRKYPRANVSVDR